MIGAHHLAILQHCLGRDEHGRQHSDRNRFVTGAGSRDFQPCMEMVEAGLMSRREKFHLAGGSDLFMATDSGVAHVDLHSPPAPPAPVLTPAQARYEDYLDAESSERFGRFICRNGVPQIETQYTRHGTEYRMYRAGPWPMTRQVSGSWAKTKKEAKASYKAALAKHHQSEKAKRTYK